MTVTQKWLTYERLPCITLWTTLFMINIFVKYPRILISSGPWSIWECDQFVTDRHFQNFPTLRACKHLWLDLMDCFMIYTLLKSDVTCRDHVVRCRGSQECGSRFVNFACQFHSRWHSLRITLKSTTLVCMHSSNVWTTKPWQRS